MDTIRVDTVLGKIKKAGSIERTRIYKQARNWGVTHRITMEMITLKVLEKDSGISDAIEYEILNICYIAWKTKTATNEKATYIANLLESKYGGIWEVIIMPSTGILGANYCPLDEMDIVLSCEEKAFQILIWKSRK